MATEATKTPTITTTNHHGHGHHHHHHNHHHVQSQQQQQPQYSRNVIENVIKSLDQLILASNVKQILEYNRRISKLLHFNNDLVDDNLDESTINSNNNNNGLQNFFRLKNALNVKTVSKWNRVASILKTLDMKANQKEYLKFRSNVHGRKILIIGGGISGLRVSIELLLLGAKVICVEKRDEFTRNNVIHLWPNVINDMCTFESKRFYGKFCVGSIDHISIRQLQLILLKIAIIYGLNFYTNITFTEICPRIIEPRIGRCSSQSIQCDCCCHQHGFGRGSYAHFQLTSMQDSGSGAGQSQTLVNYLNRQSFDVIIGCDGRRHTFSRYFRRNNRRGKLAIGLTANFINHRTEEEVQSEEISGTSRIYQQQWFQNLQDETGIELENLVYYRDNTHYFVMTATKSSLLLRGVLKTDYSDSHQLLSMNNIDTQKLMHYSKDAAEWSSKLRRLEFARNSNNMPDVALFDFTSMYSATNASCAKKIHLRCCCDQSVNINSTENSRYMLLLLCGDSLLEPFWPTGSGAGRGFLSAMDAAWTVAQWFSNVDNSYSIDSMLNVISKREYIYRLLAQTSPENIINKNFSIDPQSRYKTLNILTNDTLKEIKEQVRHLIIDKPDIDMKIYRISNEAKRARRATVGIDPNDILKAKNLHVDTSKLDEFVCQTNHNHHHHLIDYQRNDHHSILQYSVPSSSANNNNRQHCDNRNDSRSPIDVVEFLPRNHSTTTNIQNNSTRRPLDVQPRNDRLFSNMAKKNHHARNHFFHQTSNIDQHQQPQHSLHSKDIISNNCLLLSSSPSSSISSNHSKLDWISSSKNDNNLNNTSHESQIIMKQGQQNHNESSGNDKENCPIPDFKQMFLLDDYDDDNGNDDDDYLQSKSKSSMVKNRLNSMSQKMFGNPHHNDSLHDFEKSLSRRPVKKSSDIMEKAQFLEQKFEEHNRSYQPNLNRVGRIEEDDWNVKIWNDTNLFAPKIDKSGRPFVGENSRNLLQSRITQLNNNFEYNRPMISKTFLSSTTTTATANAKNNDYVNMLSAEVCQKLNSGNNNIVQPSLPIETIIGKTSSSDTTDSQIKITSAFRDPSTNIRSRIPGSSDLLKPIGDCYRCLKTLLANDRVTILGRNFHRNCLTCKICNVSLRHDELMASIDDFICKICLKIRSRQIDDIDNDSNNIIMTTSTGSTFSNSSMINDSKNAFLSQAPLSSSLNLSLMEAKKNFLENAQQIDLRERAEFELIIDDDDNTNPSNQSDNNDNDVEQQQDDVEFDIENDENQQEEINDDVDDQKQNDEQEQLQQQQQSSDLSDSSDVHCSSSDNYTDDEHSSDSSSSSCLPQRPSSIKSSTTVPLHKSSSSSSSSSSTSSNSANQKNVDHSYNIDFGSGFTSLIGTTSTTNTPTTVTNDDNSSIMNVNDDDNDDDGCVEMVATTNSKNSLTTDSITNDPIAASNLPLLSNDAYYYDGSSQCSINFNDFDEKHLPLTSTMTTELTQNEPIVQCANITQMANDNNDQNRIIVDLNCCQFVDAVDNDCDQSIMKLESPKSKINNASSAKHSHNQSSPGLKKESLIFNFNRKEPLNIDSIIKTKQQPQQQQQEMTKMSDTKITPTTIRNDNGNGKNKSSTSNNNNHSKKNIGSGSGNAVTQIKPITTATTTTTKPSNIPTYRYDGHFTEKFYRSQSQPSLFAQMDHIGNKLKMKRNYSPTTTTTNIGDNNANNTVSIKLPFVDGSPPKNDDNDKILSTPKTIFNQHRTTTNNTTTNNNNDQQSSNSSSIKSSLTQAPFARIDDV